MTQQSLARVARLLPRLGARLVPMKPLVPRFEAAPEFRSAAHDVRRGAYRGGRDEEDSLPAAD